MTSAMLTRADLGRGTYATLGLPIIETVHMYGREVDEVSGAGLDSRLSAVPGDGGPDSRAV